jgi:hypothetical protein
MNIKLFLGVVSAFILVACSGRISENDLVKLNGYWEITKVEMPDGSSKDYGINTTVDYLEINKNKGFRKKVAPQYDGTYLINDHMESLELLQLEGVYYIQYQTEYATWKEKILQLSDDSLTLENENKMIYYYKRQSSFDLNESK